MTPTTAGPSAPREEEPALPLEPLQSPRADDSSASWQLAFSPFSDRSQEAARSTHDTSTSPSADAGTGVTPSTGRSSSGGRVKCILRFIYYHTIHHVSFCVIETISHAASVWVYALPTGPVTFAQENKLERSCH